MIVFSTKDSEELKAIKETQQKPFQLPASSCTDAVAHIPLLTTSVIANTHSAISLMQERGSLGAT